MAVTMTASHYDEEFQTGKVAFEEHELLFISGKKAAQWGRVINQAEFL